MKPGYVLNAFLNISAANKISSQEVLSVTNPSRVRILQLAFSAADSNVVTSIDPASMTLYNGDPDGSSYSVILKESVYPVPYNHHARLNNSWFRLDPGNFVEAVVDDGIYVKGGGKGITFVSFTYQVG